MYRLIPGSLEVISYYKKKSGRKIGLRKTYDNQRGFYEFWRNRRSYMVYIDELQKVADEHFKSKEIMNPTTLTVTHINGRPTLKRSYFIICSQHKETGLVSMTADSPVQHQTKAIATAEAGRLAKNFPDKKFIVMEIVAVASVADVIWE